MKPFVVGIFRNRKAKNIKRFKTLHKAENFVDKVLRMCDPIGVYNGDYYIDGPNANAIVLRKKKI